MGNQRNEGELIKLILLVTAVVLCVALGLQMDNYLESKGWMKWVK